MTLPIEITARPMSRIYERAEEILEAQPVVPLSPVSVGDQGMLLCSAAALIAAGLEVLHSPAAREDFERTLVGADSKAALYRMVDALGWDRRLCANILLKNDRFGDDERKVRAVALVREMAVEVGDRLFTTAEC
jgi:hypothetical protein